MVRISRCREKIDIQNYVSIGGEKNAPSPDCIVQITILGKANVHQYAFPRVKIGALSSVSRHLHRTHGQRAGYTSQ